MLNTRGEAARKLIHITASVTAAACVSLLPSPTGAIVLAVAAAIAVGVELARQFSGDFRSWFERRLGFLLRPEEHRRVTGAATMAVGYALTAAFFPAPIAVTGILVTGVADATAAVLGKRYGRVRYPGGKTLEGSIAFFLVAWLLIMGAAGVGTLPAAVAALAATVIEAPDLAVDDNLFLPLASAAAVLGVIWLFGVQGFS